ncbi:hypothetical protein L2E82_28312 [Cichorium intybus]|uniref:Uncharacterized protein n=1 Tax=Cichorium intybus TaxID=13427 RepID=A0ACB9CVU5_CICIN|nr:hypothetical protein L2E82_28312 [Cichorium intybus]
MRRKLPLPLTRFLLVSMEWSKICITLSFAFSFLTYAFELNDLKGRMVFHCRCFSFEYEPRSRAKSSSTDTFYTASPDFKRPKSDYLTSSSLALNGSNLRVFTFDELMAATSGFGMSSKIGEGGFWSVHMGTVKSLERPFDDIQVAVKLAKSVYKKVSV